MKKFIGTKIIKAKEMTLGEYHQFKDWKPPVEEDPVTKGVLVGYPDPNGNFDGPLLDGAHYLSWSPRHVFCAAYQKVDAMTFGAAIEALKLGKKVARKGWNGKDMWLAYMSGMGLSPFSTQGAGNKVNERTAKLIGEDASLVTLPYIAMWTADKKWQPGWLASQSDMLSSDWVIIE